MAKEEFEKRRVNARAIDDRLPRKKKKKRRKTYKFPTTDAREGEEGRRREEAALIDKSNRPNAYPKMAKTLSTEVNEEGP